MVVDKKYILFRQCENILNDLRKVEKTNLKNASFLSLAVNQENRVDDILKKLIDSNMPNTSNIFVCLWQQGAP